MLRICCVNLAVDLRVSRYHFIHQEITSAYLKGLYINLYDLYVQLESWLGRRSSK